MILILMTSLTFMKTAMTLSMTTAMLITTQQMCRHQPSVKIKSYEMQEIPKVSQDKPLYKTV